MLQFLPQHEEFDCGPTAVEYLLALVGRSLPREFNRLTYTNKTLGTPHEGICALLRAGHARPCVRIGPIENVVVPSIVNYRSDGDGHYGVVVSLTTGGQGRAAGGRLVHVLDPEIGLVRTYPAETFNEIFKSHRYGSQWSVYIK